MRCPQRGDFTDRSHAFLGQVVGMAPKISHLTEDLTPNSLYFSGFCSFPNLFTGGKTHHQGPLKVTITAWPEEGRMWAPWTAVVTPVYRTLNSLEALVTCWNTLLPRFHLVVFILDWKIKSLKSSQSQ